MFMWQLHLCLFTLLYIASYIAVCNVIVFAQVVTNTLDADKKNETAEIPKHILRQTHREQQLVKIVTRKLKSGRRRFQRYQHSNLMDIALQDSAREGIKAMTELYERIVPNMIRNGYLLSDNHPAALLSKFSESVEHSNHNEMAAFATIAATKAFRKNYKFIDELARQAHTPKISVRRTALEGLCPPRDPPKCMPASDRYRTHDGTCNNKRRPRWGGAQMPFNRFLPPEYGDGVDTIRNSVEGGPLSSSRFVSLLVHGAKDGDAGLTLMTAQWGQLLDHDMTSTAQPRSVNGSIPSCCGATDFHPSCFPIKVPLDDPWLAPLKVRCLEFLRSAPAQRRDCVLSWREQTNQATSYIDASPIYSNSAKTSDNARVFRNGLLIYGRGNAANDVCQRGAIATQCIRAGDGRSGEQPGLLALHHVWVTEHNRIALQLSDMNLHWSDEKIYQETRRIVGAMFQHITYREFLPIVLGREVCKLFDLELLSEGYYNGYDPKINPSVANSFAAAAFRFGHSLIQNSYMRCDRNYNIIFSNVSLHEEFQRGDIGSAGSLHRLLRGMATQRALKRDEFITPELTNHLFQTPGFPFGLDLAAINIQRGRDHGIAPYTSWRTPCGLTPINSWTDFENVVGPESGKRIQHAYRSVHDVDLFVGGIAERPVIGGLVGPTFACIIAQQFSNSRKGDRFWYENGGFESSFTPAQLHSLRQVSLAQVLCRTVGGGTFQPHVFFPSELPGNDRVPCGIGTLAPIDLGPWLEQNPFDPPSPQASFTTETPDRVFNIIPNNLHATTKVINSLQTSKGNSVGFHNRLPSFRNTSISSGQVDFIPNGSTGFHIPNNSTKINDKLDIRRKTTASFNPIRKPMNKIHNKLDNGEKSTVKINRRRPEILNNKTVTIINNVPIELRSATAENQTSPKRPNSTTVEMKKKKLTSKNIDKVEPRTNDDINIEMISTTSGIGLNESQQHTEKETASKINTKFNQTDSQNNQTDFQQNPDNGSIESIELDGLSKSVNNRSVRTFDRNEGRVTDNTTTIEIIKSEETADIDPLTHSFSEDHIRIPRNFIEPLNAINRTKHKVNTESQTNTDNLNVTGATRDLNNIANDTSPTHRSVELRQYQTPSSSYTRPHRIIVDGPNENQYEIEINIRQSPSQKPMTNIPQSYNNYATNYADYLTATHSYTHFRQPAPTPTTTVAHAKRTKPPTVIYLSEHNEHTTTRHPGLLHNLISFAGLSAHRNPSTENTAYNEKPLYGSSPVSSSHTTNNYTPHPHTDYSSPISSTSYNQAGTYHNTNNVAGPGTYGPNTGVTNANGGESIFNVNIRPRPHITQISVTSSQIESGNYGLIPPRRPTPNQIPSELPPYDDLHANVNSPFSTAFKRPHTQTYYARNQNTQYRTASDNKGKIPHEQKLDIKDCINSSRTFESTTAKSPLSEKPELDVEESDYEYDGDGDDDDDEGETNIDPGKKFDKDGYLRPEHMLGSLFRFNQIPDTNDKCANNNSLDDNYVLPLLDNFDIMTLKTLTEFNNITKSNTDLTNIQGKHVNNDILADDYLDALIQQFSTKAPTKGKNIATETATHRPSNIAYAPIKILTKPERPDNWVIFDKLDSKTLLPKLPEVAADPNPTAEIPMPMRDLPHNWLIKHHKGVNP